MINMRPIQINNRLNGYMIKSDKFKTDLIGVYIKRKLNKEEVGLNALLSRMLVRGTRIYDTSKKLNTFLEMNYGMILVSDVVKYGDYHILQLKLQFPDPKHILDKSIFDNAIELIKALLFDPLVVDGKFKESYFEQEKYHLIDEIKSRVNDKMSYSIERCIECMYEDEAYANYVYGDIEDIEKIDNEMLYNHFQKIISTSKIDISIMGDIDFDLVADKLRSLPVEEAVLKEWTFEEHTCQKVKSIHEDFNVKQGKLVLGYDTAFTTNHELYEASVLAYYILGGSPHSKLFKLLREENSLCYYVFTKTDKFKGNMFIGAGIESENYDLVLDMISDCIKDIEVDEADLEHAKSAVVTSIRSILDFPNSFINFFYTEMLDKSLETTFDLEDMISDYMKVSIEDIMKVYKGLTLDTIYFINGGGQ